MKKILIVDDDQDILEPLSILLEADEYIVETLVEGSKTLSKIDDFHPDLLLLDILMSGSDGRTICLLLKSDQRRKNIPVIMMSAHPNAKSDAINSGADDFIAKPFEINVLRQMIQKHTKK